MVRVLKEPQDQTEEEKSASTHLNELFPDIPLGSSENIAPSPTTTTQPLPLLQDNNGDLQNMCIIDTTQPENPAVGAGDAVGGEPSNMNKYEKMRREAGITLSVDQLVNTPTMDEFNDLLSRQNFTAEQLKTCRDIRRRGKNKLTAENSRKRKYDLVKDLEDRCQEARKRGQELEREYADSRTGYLEVAGAVNKLMDRILESQGLHPCTHTIVRGEDGELKIIKKPSPSSEPQGTLRPRTLKEIEKEPKSGPSTG